VTNHIRTEEAALNAITRTPEGLSKLVEFISYKILSPCLLRMKEKDASVEHVKGLECLRHDYMLLVWMLIARCQPLVEALLDTSSVSFFNCACE